MIEPVFKVYGYLKLSTGKPRCIIARLEHRSSALNKQFTTGSLVASGLIITTNNKK